MEQQTPGGATQPDQSLWVTNPFLGGCVWDADDQINVLGFGSGRNVGTGTFTLCLIADWSPHLLYVKAAGTNLEVTVEVGGVVSTNCIVGPDYDHDAPLPPVENSNGGVGQPFNVIYKATPLPVKGKAEYGFNYGIKLPLSTTLEDWCGDSTYSDWIRVGTYPGPIYYVK